MGAKAKKTTKKTPKPSSATEAPDFLSLDGETDKKLPKDENPSTDGATVLYIGHIPHGFYEKEMEGFFKQFGKVRRLRIARNFKTGRSRHYGFIQFESPEVAKIVADCMHNYLLFEQMLQVHLIPPDRVHRKLFKGIDHTYRPPNWAELERRRHNKARTVEERDRLVKGILKRDLKRKKKIEDAGITYECPEFVGAVQTAPKKVKFDEDE